MLLRLLIASAQVKAGNTSGNFLNEIRQIICFLFLSIQQYNEFNKILKQNG